MRMVNISAIRGGEERGSNFVEGEHLLGGGLVLRQKMRVRPRPGVRKSNQIHIRSHVHFLGVVAGIRFREIEDQIGAALGQPMQGLRPSVDHVIKGFVAELGQRVGNLFPVFFYFLLAARLRRFAVGLLFLAPDVIQHRDF